MALPRKVKRHGKRPGLWKILVSDLYASVVGASLRLCELGVTLLPRFARIFAFESFASLTSDRRNWAMMDP